MHLLEFTKKYFAEIISCAVMLVCDDSLKINSLCMHNVVDYGPCLRVNPLRANPTKWSNTLTQFLDKSQRTVLVCLTTLGWRLRGELISGQCSLSAHLNKIKKRSIFCFHGHNRKGSFVRNMLNFSTLKPSNSN